MLRRHPCCFPQGRGYRTGAKTCGLSRWLSRCSARLAPRFSRVVPPLHLVERGTGGEDHGDRDRGLGRDGERTPPSDQGPSPGGEGASPGGEGASPGGEGASPGGEGASPGGEGASPGGEGASPGGEGASPGGEGASPGGEGASPGGEGASPGGEGASPGGEGASPGGEERLPAERERLPAEREPLPAERERLPAERERLPAERDRLPPAIPMVPALRETSAPIRVKSMPVHARHPVRLTRHSAGADIVPMALRLLPGPFTVETYHRLAELGVLREDARVELLDGQIVAMTPIGSRHAAAVGRLTRVFGERAGKRSIVWVQNPIVVSQTWEPQPDVCLLRPRDDFYAAAHPRADDVLLVIEVADRSLERDRDVKIPRYAAAG